MTNENQMQDIIDSEREDLSQDTVEARVRFAHQFQYLPYQSVTLDVTVNIEPQIDDLEQTIYEQVEQLQLVYGQVMLKIFEHGRGWPNEKIKRMVEKLVPANVMVHVGQNPVVMDMLIRAAEYEAEHKND